MARGPDPGVLLARALSDSAAAAGCPLVLGPIGSRDWASALYVGHRHTIPASATDDAVFAEWLRALPYAEFRLRGHVVMDVAVDSVERADGCARALLQALTVIEV